MIPSDKKFSACWQSISNNVGISSSELQDPNSAHTAINNEAVNNLNIFISS